jgi:hypothetical protein
MKLIKRRQIQKTEFSSSKNFQDCLVDAYSKVLKITNMLFLFKYILGNSLFLPNIQVSQNYVNA